MDVLILTLTFARLKNDMNVYREKIRANKVMNYTKLFLISLFSLLSGCGVIPLTSKTMTVSFTNKSRHDLEDVCLTTEKGRLLGGNVGRTFTSAMVGTPWKNISGAKTGYVEFVDSESKTHYKVAVPIQEINRRVNRITCNEVSIEILDYDHVEFSYSSEG